MVWVNKRSDSISWKAYIPDVVCDVLMIAEWVDQWLTVLMTHRIVFSSTFVSSLWQGSYGETIPHRYLQLLKYSFICTCSDPFVCGIMLQCFPYQPTMGFCVYWYHIKDVQWQVSTVIHTRFWVIQCWYSSSWQGEVNWFYFLMKIFVPCESHMIYVMVFGDGILSTQSCEKDENQDNIFEMTLYFCIFLCMICQTMIYSTNIQTFVSHGVMFGEF